MSIQRYSASSLQKLSSGGYRYPDVLLSSVLGSVSRLGPWVI
jgi:hypothetical protein